VTDHAPPVSGLFRAWTEAERETWSAWSKVEQDLSQPETRHVCSDMLDALETSAQQMAKLQSMAVRSGCAGLQANPLLPPPARVLIERTCGPLTSLTDWQQQLISAWFGMARQVAVTVRPPGHLD
jgi:hypothetical protein